MYLFKHFTINIFVPFDLSDKKTFLYLIFLYTSLLRRLQAQTLPDATQPIGKIYPFTKMTITFEPLMRF